MHLFILAGFAALLVSACASPAVSEWTRGDASSPRSGELEIDTFVCERWSPAGGGKINAGSFRNCMIARGWEPIGNAQQ